MKISYFYLGKNPGSGIEDKWKWGTGTVDC